MAGLLGDVLPYLYSRGNALTRHVKGLLSDPLASMEQTAGLLNDKYREHNALMDVAFANKDRPFQVTDPAALERASMGMLTGPLGVAPVGMAQLVKPLGTAPHYATPDLAEYTERLYRETSPDRAADFLPNSMSQPQTLWFSNEPAYALGQGANRGVMLEFDAKGIPGQLSLKKPMAREAYEKGNAEFVSQDAMPSELGANLQSIRITKDQQRGPYFRRIQGLLKDWNVQKEADGTLVLTRPN